MKKYFYLFALLTLTTLTSCNNDDDDDYNKQVVTATINTRAIDGSEVYFSQSNGQIELNYSNNTIQITYDFKDAAGQSHNMTTSAMPMTASSSTTYQFTESGSSSYYGTLQGLIDLATGVMWYKFTIDDVTIVSTTQLLYAYATTSIDNNTFSHTQSAYLFALDSKGETATLQIGNFISDTNGSVQATIIEYNGLNVTPTATGYAIAAAEVESSYSGYFTLTDVNFDINEQCRTVSGSFKCNGHEFTVSGYMFN